MYKKTLKQLLHDYNLEGHREIAKAMPVHEISHRHLTIRAILAAPGWIVLTVGYWC